MAKSGSLSHLDEQGRARMVDVGHKAVTARQAIAEGTIRMSAATLKAIAEERIAKGEVLGTARVAGILAAKRTGELIPLCHPLAIESITVDFDVPVLESDPASAAEQVPIRIRATARINAKTGVEMEALTAVSIAALTIYDMCKAIDKTMVIEGIHLLSKSGGSSSLQAVAPPSRPGG